MSIDEGFTAILRFALAVVSEKATVMISLFMSFSLACWAMYDPTPLRLGAIGIFCVLVFLPVLSKMTAKKPEEGNG